MALVVRLSAVATAAAGWKLDAAGASSLDLDLTLKGLDGIYDRSELKGLGGSLALRLRGGQLSLDSPGLTVRWVQGRAQLEGSLRIDALDVSSRLSTLAPLGSYRLTLAAPEGEDMRLGLNTLGGALLLSGEGQWVGGRLRFKGEAQASEDHEAALSNLLNIVGKRNGRRSLIALG